MDELPTPEGQRWETANTLLARALRSHQGPTPVALLAGDLEAGAGWDRAELLPIDAYPVSSVLNGHAPLRPQSMPGGILLAPVGLAMRGLITGAGTHFPKVNLMTNPGRRVGRFFPSLPKDLAASRWLAAAAVAAAVVIWGVVGVGIATLLGLHPRLPLGP